MNVVFDQFNNCCLLYLFSFPFPMVGSDNIYQKYQVLRWLEITCKCNFTIARATKTTLLQPLTWCKQKNWASEPALFKFLQYLIFFFPEILLIVTQSIIYNLCHFWRHFRPSDMITSPITLGMFTECWWCLCYYQNLINIWIWYLIVRIIIWPKIKVLYF